jgi:hypothetical protein
MRISDKQLLYFENMTAVALRMQSRIRRLLYEVDDPDVLADLAGLAADAALIRNAAIAEKDRLKAEREEG